MMKLVHNSPLANYTSLRVGGPAGNLIQTEDGDNLVQIIDGQAPEPVWVLGYGTNCLISDNGLPGTVILNQTGGIDELSETRFKVESGANWDDFVQLAIAKNLWGLEFMSGIPGGVGAAVAGNIAAYGHKVADIFIEATMLNTKDGTVEVWPKENFKFDYRASALQQPSNAHQVVLDATFQLSPAPAGELEYESALKVAGELGLKPDSLTNRRQIILKTRDRAGSLLQNPAGGPWTAGSFFKNPLVGESQVQAIISYEETGVTREQLLRQNLIHGQDKARVSAAHVLLAAGFKRGQTWGQVRLHPDHILKVENMGRATAKEIYDVVQEILTTVKEKLDVNLEPEVRFLGEF